MYLDNQGNLSFENVVSIFKGQNHVLKEFSENPDQNFDSANIFQIDHSKEDII